MSEYSYRIAGFRTVIRAFLDRGYQAVGYRDFTPEQGRFLLRHDIDISLDHAVRQAQVNADLGVAATFFFLVSAEQYNLFSDAGRRALATIAGLGQHLGLHFDAALYPDTADLDAAAAHEAGILSAITGRELEAISFHRPVTALHGREGLLAGLPHAYEPRFFSEIDYCSDSRGRFRHGGPLERQAFLDFAPVHLLTHPIWWMREEELSPVDALLDFLAHREAALARDLAGNCSPFADYLKTL